jgi:uncharacterized protein YaaQ
MKMVMAVMPRSESERVLHALVNAGYTATFVETRGGMLRQAQMTLFIATQRDELEQVLRIVQENCHSDVTVETTEEEAFIPTRSAKTKVGGAVVFVWDLEQFEAY